MAEGGERVFSEEERVCSGGPAKQEVSLQQDSGGMPLHGTQVTYGVRKSTGEGREREII